MPQTTPPPSPPLQKPSLSPPFQPRDNDTFAARRWQWYLDNVAMGFVPIGKVYEGDEELADFRAACYHVLRPERPKDVNDILIQMVRVSEHLRRCGHRVKSWDNVRLRISDAALSGAEKTMRIEAELMLKQHEVFDGFENAVNYRSRFLSKKLAVGEAGFRRAKAMLRLLENQSPCHEQSEELLAANIKRIRRRANRPQLGPAIFDFHKDIKQQAVEWERARKEAPHSLYQYEARKKLEEMLNVRSKADEDSDNKAMADSDDWYNAFPETSCCMC